MDRWNAKLRWSANAFERSLSAARALGDEPSLQTIRNRLEKLEEIYTEYLDVTKKLYVYINTDGFVDPSETEVNCEKQYYEAHDLLSKALKAATPETVPSDSFTNSETLTQLAAQQTEFLRAVSSTTIQAEVPFEKMKIPSFSGTYQEWPSFHDLYMTAIGNKQGLSNTQKFHYLKSYLTGEALGLIKHLALTEDNYPEAWSRLKQRYDRKPLIIRSFVQSFFSLPSLTSANVVTLRKIADGADEVIRGLKALKCESRDPWLIHILLKKVDNDTKQAWAEKHDVKIEPSFDDFLSFLSLRCDALESYQSPRSSSGRTSAVTNIATTDDNNEEDAKQNSKKCKHCNELHALSTCDKFKGLDFDSKCVFVKAHNLCFNCLSSNHHVEKCTSKFRCRHCHKKHHTILHKTQSTNRQTTNSSAPLDSSVASGSTNSTAPPPAIVHHSNQISFSVGTQTLLPTIRVRVKDNFGSFVECRVLLDTGSTASLVTEAFIQRIGVIRSHARVTIAGLAGTNAGISRGQVNIKLRSRFSHNAKSVDLLIMQKITSSIPTQPIDCTASYWAEILKLDLADPKFSVPGPIDVLIGSDQLWSIYTGEFRQYGPALPVALKTIFGWVIAGPCGVPNGNNSNEFSNHALTDIDTMLRMLMEMDTIQTTDAKINEQDPTEVHFIQTHSRHSDGTYIVKYPFKDHAPPIHFTLPQALKRLGHTERRLRNDINLSQQYTEFMEEYESLGHMERIPDHEVDIGKENVYYLPHHAILKPSSTTTKCRVVFDGSARDTSGVSLNDRLHIGPPIQRDIFGVSIRFRQHRYVFSADIAKMFRGIKVAKDHTNFQRILWRNDETAQIQHFRLLTVTYGLASSPFLAVRVLKQMSDDYQSRYPIASRVIRSDAYVDDILTGCDSVEELIMLKEELMQLLQQANFKLRKWSSNCWPLLETLPSEHCALEPIDLLSKNSVVTILGLSWNPGTDEFFLKVNNPSVQQRPTKRIILSEMSKVYDPIGIVAPVVVVFKALFQETWLLVKSWDDELPETICQRWATYMENLSELSKIRIPRYISIPLGAIELHGFADASSIACAAVVYSRFQVGTAFDIKFIAAKTRVAPLKPLSIPRLELNAAVLLSRLLLLVKSSLTIPISGMYCWSDSQIVLHWLSSPPRKWKTFVCNRTAEILDVCPRECWRHVISKENPADCASRGLTPAALLDYELWWNGPTWLKFPMEQWPISKVDSSLNTDLEVVSETRVNREQTLFLNNSDDIIERLVDKISSWNRLVRTVAYCLRFIKSSNKTFAHPLGDNVCFSTLSASELKQSSNVIFRHMQITAFTRDMQALNGTGRLPHKSRLLRLTPFFDPTRILRVGGRLTNATLSYNAAHPILLPRDSKATILLIRHVHYSNLHPGVDATFFLLRQHFWILGCRNLVRKVVFQCKPCFMQRRTTSSQLMGDLPKARVTPIRSFLHCGLDYAGPLLIKTSKGRNPKHGKAWFAIFVCLASKAFHIELVSDLTTDAFLAAFRRFCARRGKPSDLYSDNGTTFRGAKRSLDELQQLAISTSHNSEVATILAQDGINWHFIPPSAPHFGGLWESGVRSVKLHLRRVIGSNVLTYEEYATVLTQIEAVLNSRPLCTNSDNQLDPVTPAHLLNGGPYTSLPEPSLLEKKPNLLHRWRSLQAKVQGFWKRWQAEYLTSLQQRSKWHHAQPNIQVGQIVVLKEPHLPPSKWLIGQVQDVTVGADNLVRVVTVRTSRGTYKRPVTRIALLPCAEQ